MPADNRVLLLDMHGARRKRLAAMLSRLGYTVIPAGQVGVAQATREIQATPIVIAELRDQGDQVAELRALLPESAIVIIGPRALPAALAVWHAGAEAYVPRPVREDELASALEHMLRRRAAHAAALAEARAAPSAPAEFRGMAAELARLINTPLAALLAMNDLLAEELSPDHPGHEYAQALTAAALRIRDIAWMLADIGRKIE
jgi:DNA-binding NtrC family response regulator